MKGKTHHSVGMVSMEIVARAAKTLLHEMMRKNNIVACVEAINKIVGSIAGAEAFWNNVSIKQIAYYSKRVQAPIDSNKLCTKFKLR